MNHINLFDILLVLLMFVVVPIHSYFTFPGIVREIRQNGSATRVSAYKKTIATWVVFALLLVVLWLTTGRSWGDLGFRSSTLSQLSIGFAIGLAFLVFLVWQLRSLARSDSGGDFARQQLGDLAEFMPVTARDSYWFRWVSFNAGITEEMLFRGYLIWLFEPALGLTMAGVISVAVFTFAHSYQGIKQLPAIFLVSAVTVIIFVVSGSLWLPILFHIVLDVVQGKYLKSILSNRGSSQLASGSV